MSTPRPATLPDTVQVHVLKTWPVPFQAMRAEEKLYELRKDDRDYRVGDVLVLCEYDPTADTFSREVDFYEVTYKTPGGAFGLPVGLCILGCGPRHWFWFEPPAEKRFLMEAAEALWAAHAAAKEAAR